MRLRRLEIGRLPGIDEAFALEELGDGFHVIVGPNGIGKSSLCRAARALLWSELGPETRVSVSALFEHEGSQWRVERDGGLHRWLLDGVEADPPLLPPAHLVGCFFLLLRDLLDPASDAGRDVATEIRRRMAGGFDLEAATEVFGRVGRRHGQGQRREYDRAQQDVHRAAADHAEIARRQETLDELDQQVRDGTDADRRLAHVETAAGVLELRGEFEGVETSLQPLPPCLDRLTGEEAERIEGREREIAEKREDRVRMESALEDGQRILKQSGLVEPVDSAALETWRTRAGDLTRLEVELEQARRGLAGSRRGLEDARKALGLRGDHAPLDIEAGEELFEFLDDAQKLVQQRQVLDDRIRLLVSHGPSEEDLRRLDTIRAGVGALRDWLRVPRAGSGLGASRGSARRRVLFGLAVGLGLGGTLLALWLHPAIGAVAGLGLGLLVTLLLDRPDAGGLAALTAAKVAFPSGLESPKSWTVDQVGARLRELEGESSSLDAARLRARDRDVERRTHENNRDGLTPQTEALERRRLELCQRLGLEKDLREEKIVDVARRLDRLRQAWAEEREVAARVECGEARHAELLSDLASVLDSYGDQGATDAASASAGIERLARRDTMFAQGRSLADTVGLSLERTDLEITKIEGIIAEVFQQADLEPGDRAGLARRLEDLDRYRVLRPKRDLLAERIKDAVARLEAAGASDLCDLDEAALAEERRRLEDTAGRAEERRIEIARIQADVDRAREGHDLEDRLARCSQALDKLRDAREEALLAEAGRFLIDTVKEQHESTQMPRVLERARELFSAFTHHAYELQVSPLDDSSFVAIDSRSGEGRRPDELSDGTRAQMLLAARLSFAEEAERGTRLPLFLDEALDHSDPIRFQAIARGLGRMVDEQQRQIFYLTNDPADVGRIRSALQAEGCEEPRVIDLGQLRGRASSVGGPEDLQVPPLPAVPSPEGRSPESYGAALGVPVLDPSRPVGAQHLFYLIPDDLDLLHGLLEQRIEHVGTWRLAARGERAGASARDPTGEVASQIDARADLLEVFCRARAEGRGRRVDREALERSYAISDRYIDDVSAIAAELDGDAARLIQVLGDHEDERLRGFRSGATEKLNRFLLDEEYLDPRPVLDEPTLQARVLASPAARRLPGSVAAHCIHRWWTLART